jgi:hypothetical protein
VAHVEFVVLHSHSPKIKSLSVIPAITGGGWTRLKRPVGVAV